MIFCKPEYFEITLANWRKDDFHDEILVCTIDENYRVIQHAPIDLFLYSRNMAVIYGLSNNGECLSKNLMDVGTKKQSYAGWSPILNKVDFENMIHHKIKKELSKKMLYESDDKAYSFYKLYS